MGIHHHLGRSMLSLGIRLPRKSLDKTRTLHACVWSVLCDLMNCCVNGVYTIVMYCDCLCAKVRNYDLRDLDNEMNRNA